MAEEKKLGPSATYVPEEGEGAPSVNMGGVTFVAGEAVNIVDMLGEDKAQDTLKRLAGNPAFKVDGGPDHKAMAEKKAETEEKGKQAADRAREKDQQKEQQQQQKEQQQQQDKAQMPDQPKPADDERSSPSRRR